MAPKYGIKPVVGIDFRNGAKQKYVGIARNNEGFRELNEHLTYHLHHNIPFADKAPAFQHAYVIYQRGAVAVKDLRDNEFIGVSTRTVNKLLFANKTEEQHKWVFLQPATFINKKGFNTHRLLRAIDNNTLLSKLSKDEEAHESDIFRSPTELMRIFEQYPSILINTQRLLTDCSITMDFNTSKNKLFYRGSVANDIALLREESIKGLKYRYGDNPPSNVIERMNYELSIIQQMHFSAYFLINWDMVNYARSKGYFYIGRGSGANSLIAYLMRITDVDPVELNLYFERFINPYRTSPPDFDIDFSWTDREDVTRYIFNTYGTTHTALVGAYNTFQTKSVIRELGKVFGLPAHEIDVLQAGRKLNNADKIGQAVFKYAQLINDFPSHLSIHSSGLLISELPVSSYCATSLPPKGFPTTHFSMLEAEDVGLHKYDILAQRGLGKIKDTVQLIRENRGVEVDIHDIPKFKNDVRVKSMLKVGKTIGCFYVESPAMRMLLTKLKADDYIGLVAASSIIRPGVAKSGMMREYILRFQHEDRREAARKALPELYAILEETYGVMVYQEDVLKVAHLFGGLTLAEADVLRRGMNWKYMQREEFRSVRQKFLDNCKQKGHADAVVQDIWNQIESFANFAFAKGHSASYAVESFQALYLKAYYPIEYMVATLNNGGGFYNTELYVHEAKMNGATVEAPCINQSEATSTLQGDVVYLGLASIAELETTSVTLILDERRKTGNFTSLDNFINRVPLSLDQLILLIRVGAFHFTGTGVKQLLWDAHLRLNKQKKRIETLSMFQPEVKKYRLPTLWDHPLEEAYAQKELLGFSLQSPFSLLKEQTITPLLAGHLPFKVNEQVCIVGYLVHRKRTPTSNGQEMCFGTWLDLVGEWIDTVHFPQSATEFPFSGPGCYQIHGTVKEEFGFICLEVSSMSRMANVSLDDVLKNDLQTTI